MHHPITEPCAHDLVERRAAITPDAVAVLWVGGSLTFRQLDEQATQLAHRLADVGVYQECAVAVALEPSPSMLVTLLAIWKAGAVYVPLDVSIPDSLASGMIADAEVVLLIHQGAIAARSSTVPTIDLDDLDLDLSGAPDPRPRVNVHPENLAYCVFTSGSTGRPKPVAVAHASLLNHARSLGTELGLESSDRVLQSTAPAIDASLEEILPAWVCGAAVALPPSRRSTSSELTKTIELLSITVVSLASAYWHHWVDDLSSGLVHLPSCLRLVFVGGDKILTDKLQIWYRTPGAARIEWISDYGPTETTISVALYRPAPALEAEPDSERYAIVPLGRPFAGTSIYVLDANLRPVPDGEPGDLWVAGRALARGYHGAPAATAARFRPDPHGPPGSRMYRTGDRGSRQLDGNILFHGRADGQVKVRGFRVELGQVESALHHCGGVREAVVISVDDPGFGSRLVAYVEVEHGVTEPGLRAEAATRLPDAMVPSTIILLDRLPRSRLNGKVAIAELPSPVPVPAAVPPVVDMTALERVLSNLFGGVLGRPPPGLRDDFFAAGGDSLRALQLLSQIHEVTGVGLTFVQFRNAANVSDVADLVGGEHRRRGAAVVLVQVSHDGDRRPASVGQEALWFLHQVQRSAPTYSIPVCYRVRGALDLDRLDMALNTVVSRHEALRTVLDMRGGKLSQRVAPTANLRTTVIETSDAVTALHEAGAESRRPFDLSHGPLLRSTCFRLDIDDHVWLLVLHHAIIDAWSLALFWRELIDCYANRQLPEPGLQYGDYASWQRSWLAAAEADAQRSYWREQLAGRLPVIALGMPPSGRRRSYEGFAIELPPEHLQEASVVRVAADCSTTVFVVLLATFFAALRQAVEANDIVVGAPIACRNRPGTATIVGYLVNTVALRIHIAEGMRFRDVIARTDELVALALSNQDLPFPAVIADRRRHGDTGNDPVFDAMFGMQSTTVDTPVGFEGLDMDECFVHTGTAKVALTWTVRQTRLGLASELEFASDRFDEDTAFRWEHYLLRVLAAGLADPSTLVDDLPGLHDAAEPTRTELR